MATSGYPVNYDANTQALNLTYIASLLYEVRLQLNNLRQDFYAHDHGNTGSYAQASVRIGSSADTVTNTVNVASAVSAATLPLNPLIADNFLSI